MKWPREHSFMTIISDEVHESIPWFHEYVHS